MLAERSYTSPPASSVCIQLLLPYIQSTVWLWTLAISSEADDLPYRYVCTCKYKIPIFHLIIITSLFCSFLLQYTIHIDIDYCTVLTLCHVFWFWVQNSEIICTSARNAMNGYSTVCLFVYKLQVVVLKDTGTYNIYSVYNLFQVLT